MLVEPNYRSFRIEVTAQHVDGAWNAEVRIRPHLVRDEAPRRAGDVPEADREGGGRARLGLRAAVG